MLGTRCRPARFRQRHRHVGDYTVLEFTPGPLVPKGKERQTCCTA
jgi:hypothetical protein